MLILDPRTEEKIYGFFKNENFYSIILNDKVSQDKQN